MILDRGVGMWASTEGPRSELVANFGQKERRLRRMKRILALVLVTVTLVASLGFASLAGAAPVSADGAEVQGRGTLTAAGDGIAILGGNGAVSISGNGILWVRDLAGGAIIEVTGYGEKKEFADGWLQYSGFGGNAYVEGTRIVVVLAGVDIELSAEGRGRVILWGHGTYELSGRTADWGTGFGARVKL